ncbi:MAG: hypothetical protein DMD83_12875 [Candidatus Rokuibacteriota bacterium]|nr:MAG: hypothetical protein DMD83_12875 [Candidatus Rokubacteria bacterium]
MLLLPSGMNEDWWVETDSAILQCLRERGAMSPTDLARQLGISPGESTAFVCLLVAQGKVNVRLVALSEEAPGPPVPAPSRNRSRRERSKQTALTPTSRPVGHRSPAALRG